MNIVDGAYINFDIIVDAVRPFHCLKDPDTELPALLTAFAWTKKRSVLEIGTWQGATTAALRLAFPDAAIWTVDLPNPETSKFNPQGRALTGVAHRRLLGRTIKPIKQLWMDSADLLAAYGGPDGPRFDMVFVDGDHSTDGCHRDLHTAASLLDEGGVIVAHDYTEEGIDQEPRPHWTKDVERAVNWFLKERPDFRKERLAGWLVKLSCRELQRAQEKR